MWLVGKISTHLPVESAETGKIDIDLCWAYGMVGVCPVFESFETAKQHAGDAEIYKINEWPEPLSEEE